MRDFFRGWRRKIGVVSLVMACVAMGWWMTSSSYSDTFVVKIGHNSAFAVQSRVNEILAICVVDDEHGLFVNRSFYSQEANNTQTFHFDPNRYDWRWHWNGFQLGKGSQEHETLEAVLTNSGTTAFKLLRGNRPMSFVGIPHWFNTAFLTALSAYLLLKKPRKSNQRKIMEPIGNEGA